MADVKKRNILFRVFAILFIAIILIFSKKENQQKFIEFIDANSVDYNRLSVINSISVDGSIDDAFYYDDHIIIWQDNKLAIYNNEGLKEWEKEFNFTDTYVTFGNQGIYVYDRELGDIYYLNMEGDTIGRFNVGGEIKSIKEQFGYILVHMEEGLEGIKIIDNKGKAIFSNFIEGKNILRYCFHNEIDEYALATFDIEDEKVISDIQLYNLQNELLWDFTFEDEIVMYLDFVDGDKLLAMSDKKLYCIDDGSILWQRDYPTIKDIYVYAENIYILHDEKYEILSLNGDVKKSASISEEYNKFTIVEGYTILYGKGNITGFKGSKRAFEYEADGSIMKVIEGNKNLIVIYGNRVDIVIF